MSTDNKKTMRIAMIGVSPADQIAFKGYLRVLLRLDVELEWVAAQEGNVALYAINQEFQNSSSVLRITEMNPNTPVLYISRNSDGVEGGVSGNTLFLPLKQINALNEWLYANIQQLKGMPYQKYSASTTDNVQPSVEATSQAAPQTLQQQTTQTAQPSQRASVVVGTPPKIDGLIEMIKTLHKREAAMYELVQGDVVVAIIEASKQRLWTVDASKILIKEWQLRPYSGEQPEVRDSVDLNQWLYDTVWETADVISVLTQRTQKYQLRSWAKPSDNQSRRTLLQVMTVLEKRPSTIDEIVRLTGANKLTVEDIIVSLLVSNHLADVNYQDIKVEMPYTNTVQSEPVEEVVVAPVPPAPEQEEKMGFLSRLRRKLGL